MKNKLLHTVMVLTLGLGIFNAQNSGLKVLKSIPAEGNGGWDYIQINPLNHYLYASHSTQVNIIDPETLASKGIIKNQQGVHGIGFDQKNRGYVTNGKSNSVYVFDVATNEKVSSIEVGTKPDAVIYDAFSGKVIVANAGSNSLSIIDPSSLKVESTITLIGNPEYMASDGKGKIYVNIEDKSKIAEVNLKQQKVLQYFSLASGESPSGLALNLKNHHLFAACENGLFIVDATNGKLVTNLPIGKGCDGVAFDPETNHIFASNYDGTLSVYTQNATGQYIKLDNIITEVGARTLTLDPVSHKVYLPTAQYEKQIRENEKRLRMIDGTFHILEVGK
ncbi:YncE family protein [Kaistella flava (ex Peng et al. 2021)]|uniref:YncE family protein n=1 Tax=Kaistella flava (ex Peng et al. 2021) TaxID=2038776 RepID=A0A7M2Y5Z2_9FLAO|nr:YncE family protein [Kaistella flava (ex Peng et al. 2021)]QOW09581.1 YncE family protein [Kaistella flava (ex Peng et al. 2021)]